MSDAALRFAVTLGLLTLFFTLETTMPARASVFRETRVLGNVGLALISAILARLALAGGLASIAIYCHAHGFGLLNLIIVPHWLAIVVSFLALDVAIWWQHKMMHALPFLWRLHRVHHSDVAMDVTTALRFHPMEILVSLGFKIVMVGLLGAPAAAVLFFEMALGAGALFTHANIALPAKFEQVVQTIFLTPALHLIHHSPDPIETNSNFGFSFSIWDRLFGTFRAHRLAGSTSIGLEKWRAPRDQNLGALLGNPFD